MDVKNLSQLLKDTIDPNKRNEAEEKLTQVTFFFNYTNALPILCQHGRKFNNDLVACLAS